MKQLQKKDGCVMEMFARELKVFLVSFYDGDVLMRVRLIVTCGNMNKIWLLYYRLYEL